jgi:hypothetical protein
MTVGGVLFLRRVVDFWFLNALGSNIVNLLVVTMGFWLWAQGTDLAVPLHSGLHAAATMADV